MELPNPATPSLEQPASQFQGTLHHQASFKTVRGSFIIGTHWVFPPKIMPWLQTLYILQEDVNSVDNFCFVDHQALPLSLRQLFSSFLTSPSSLGSWASNSQPGLWSHLSCGDRDIDKYLLLLMFLLLREPQEAVGENLHNSVYSLTEKYACCTSDVQRNKSTGKAGCPEQGKRTVPFRAPCVDKKLGQGPVKAQSTEGSCPCGAWKSVYAWVLPCVKWHQN